MLRTAPLLALLLSACPSAPPDEPWTCTQRDVPTDTLEASVDGASWDAAYSGGSVTNAGGLNITFRVDANNTMSLRLLTAATFVALDDYELTDPLVADNALTFTAADLPLEVALGEGATDGGDATLIIGSASYNTDHGAGGYARIDRLDGQNLGGCLFFGAGLQDGSDEVHMADGSFSATLP